MMESDDIFAPEPLPDGFELAGYRIIECLRGPKELQAVCSDTSIIYKAENFFSGDIVALKEYMPPATVRSADGSLLSVHGWDVEDFQPYVERFVRCARLAARYKHPSVVPIWDILRMGNTAIIVMPYVGDMNLRDAVRMNRIDSERQLYYLLHSLLEAVSVIHGCGGLHGDIKPSNIVIAEDGTPVLIDTDSGMQMDCSIATVYTEGFSAPEQRCAKKGESFGPSADVYAIGATLKYLIYGTVNGGFRELIPCGEQLIQDLDKATEPDPAARWQSAEEWLEAIGSVDYAPVTVEESADSGPEPGAYDVEPVPPTQTEEPLYPEEDATAITLFDDVEYTQRIVRGEGPDDWVEIPQENQPAPVPQVQPLEELSVRTSRALPKGGAESWELQVCEPLEPLTVVNGYTLLDVARYEHNAIAYNARDALGCECEIVEFTPSGECERKDGRIAGWGGFDVKMLEYLQALGRVGEIELDGAMPWHSPEASGSELLFFANGTAYHWRERRDCRLIARLFETLPEDPGAPALYASALECIVKALEGVHSRGVVHGNITFGSILGDIGGAGGISFSVPALGLLPAYAVDCSEPPFYFREEMPVACRGMELDRYMVGAMFHYLLTGSYRRQGGHCYGLQIKQMLSQNDKLCRLFAPKWLETIDTAMNPEEDRTGWPGTYQWLCALQEL